MRLKIFTALLFFVSSAIFFTSCGGRSLENMIIATQATIDSGVPDYVTGDSWRYIEKTSLVAINPDKPEKSPTLLTEAFYSARSPEISCDGKQMLFAAQKNKNDTWQIWGMNLKSLKTKQVTFSHENSIDPAFLPDGRLVFSRSLQNDSLKAGHTLFTCNPDGSDLRRITFNPHTYFAPTILKDGRVLSLSRQVYPVISKSAMMVSRPDGTKSELFYKKTDGGELLSRGWETSDGRIIFIESADDTEKGGSIISISYNRPLHSRTNLSSSIEGDFNSAFPLDPGRLIVSFRRSENERFALYLFDSEKMILDNPIYQNSEYDIIEAVVVKEQDRSKKLPSEVDMGVKTGLLLCQDINITAMQSPDSKKNIHVADRIEVVGLDSILGVVKVEEDGSFYLKVAADMPFRINTLDTDGLVVNGPGSWIWLRPNERRGCVGCHEDNERVPANRYALAVKKDPAPIPVSVLGLKEKEIELE